MDKRKIIFIFFILSLGLFLRIWGIGYGLPDLSHPDEARVILDTLSMGHRASLLPERPDYALLYRYFLLVLFGAYFVIGRIFGMFHNAYDFAFKFMVNPTNIYLIGRTVSAVFGTAIGLAAYFLGKRTFKKEEIGITAMVFSLFEFQLLQHSQWAIYPIILCFFTLPAFYYMFKVTRSQRPGDFMLMGLTCGLAISVQNQGIYLLPSFLLSLILNYKRNQGVYKLKAYLKNSGLAVIFLMIFSLLGNFYWFFIFNKSLAKTLELMGVTRVGFSSAAPYSYNFLSMLWWFIAEIIRQDGILGVLMVAGIFYSAYKHTDYDLIYLAFIFIYLWAVSSWGFRILHDVISLLPITALFASRCVIEITERLIKKKYYYAIISCIIVLPLIVDASGADIKKNHKDTRQVAREWIEANIPAGSRVATDWPIYSVPLKSEVPFLFRNPIAFDYFNSKLPFSLKNEYRGYLEGQKTYQLYDIMYSTQAPLWPRDMPLSVIEQAKKRYVYRDLYSRFNFRSQDEIRRQGVQYIIITSYAWGFFLFDHDPDKNNLFNPFFKDRPELNYHHADHYLADNRHGVLFFLAKQGRDFYEPLLNNRVPDIRLLKEFAPADNLGPTIKIFKFTNG